MSTNTQPYLRSIHTCYPDLAIESARFHDKADGQFNIILWVNERLIFRFPRSTNIADTFATSVKLISFLAPQLPLPIPRPLFQNLDPDQCDHIFIAFEAGITDYR